MTTPVGRAHQYPKRSDNFTVFGAPASLIGSELPWLTGSGLYTVRGRAVSFISPSRLARPFALPHPDKPCNYHQRGALPASTSDSGVGLTQLFNHYFEEEKNDGAKDHHDHRGARAGAKMCRVGLATL